MAQFEDSESLKVCRSTSAEGWSGWGTSPRWASRASACGRRGVQRKVLPEPKLGELGDCTRERVVVQMEKWLQIVKYIRANGSQVSHGYRMEL